MTILNNKKNIVIIDLGISNVQSVLRAFNCFEQNVKISDNIKDLNEASHLVLPGVGSFEKGIKSLIEKNLHDTLLNLVEIKNIPILGICLGMQLFATCGFENNVKTKGLNLIPGEVVKIREIDDIRIPHVGWNNVNFLKKNSILINVENNSNYYFTHSYHLNCLHKEDVVAETNYGLDFVSIIGKKNIYGVQFHPEKSLKSGIKILDNFSKINA